MICDVYCKAWCTAGRVIRNFFGVPRHEAIVTKINFMSARMLYAKVDKLCFSSNFYSQNNRKDVSEMKMQRRNQKAADKHICLHM